MRARGHGDTDIALAYQRLLAWRRAEAAGLVERTELPCGSAVLTIKPAPDFPPGP
jgi:hypothetical protein